MLGKFPCLRTLYDYKQGSRKQMRKLDTHNMTHQHLRLPELESIWPWPRLVSSHLPEINQECLDWAASFGAFDPETQRLVHEKGKLNLLAGMCYARMRKDHVKSGCDLMHLFFMIDEHTDKAGPARARDQVRTILDAFDNPDKVRPPEEWPGGEFTRQFWTRIPKDATESFRKRFRATWVDYVESVARQAEIRSQSCILDLDSYLPLRRHTSGAPSTIALYEMDMDIPDHIREHPIVVELETIAVDLIVIANDLLSYNKEQAVGDDQHSIVTVVMKQYNLGAQEAIDEAGRLSQAKMERFYTLYSQLPRWIEPVDLDVQRLVDGMAQCVSGVMHWSYESQRYFGERGLEVKKTRMVPLLPQIRESETIGPVPVEDIQAAWRQHRGVI
ncbi:isoprenoid synthase domain-containing protein [Xylariomycetidae sp. FL2044]|nr:isoprenoid synthase domain-containing protein [Xylariomycetidae sp. FL2044]